MLVSFWSPSYREETAQILTLVGGMCCRSYPCSIVSAENYLHTRNLGFHLLGSRYDSVRRGAKRGSEVYYKAGEIFVRHVCKEMGRSSRFGSVIRADGNGMMFMPLDQSLYEDSYRFMVREALDQQIDFLESRFDEVFLNLQPNENDTTMSMIDRSDVVVVCLPAKPESFEAFFDRYRSLFGKCYIVFFGMGAPPKNLKSVVQRMAPGFVTRCCYLQMTRLLRNYLADGRGLDYLDRFRSVLDRSAVPGLKIAEEPSVYRTTGLALQNGDSSEDSVERVAAYRYMQMPGETDSADYIRWKNETDRRIGADMLAAANFGEPSDGESERVTMRAIRHLSDWLIRQEFFDAGGDLATITERMIRRRMIPHEMIEWEMME